MSKYFEYIECSVDKRHRTTWDIRRDSRETTQSMVETWDFTIKEDKLIKYEYGGNLNAIYMVRVRISDSLQDRKFFWRKEALLKPATSAIDAVAELWVKGIAATNGTPTGYSTVPDTWQALGNINKEHLEAVVEEASVISGVPLQFIARSN